MALCAVDCEPHLSDRSALGSGTLFSRRAASAPGGTAEGSFARGEGDSQANVGGFGSSSMNLAPDVDDLDLYIEPNQPAFQQLSNLEVEADHLYTFIVTGTAGHLDVVRVEGLIER